MAELASFVPSSEAINKLPKPIRKYIHDLETKCDPSGDLAARRCAEENNSALINQLAESQAGAAKLRDALDQLESFVAIMVGRGPDCVIPETINAPMGVPIKIGEIMRETKEALASDAGKLILAKLKRLRKEVTDAVKGLESIDVPQHPEKTIGERILMLVSELMAKAGAEDEQELATLRQQLADMPRLRKLLEEVYGQVGNEAPPNRRHALTPGLRDEIRESIRAWGYFAKPEQLSIEQRSGEIPPSVQASVSRGLSEGTDAAKPKEESAWLIERKINNQPVWWNPDACGPIGNWTTDACMAKKFATHTHASAVAETLPLKCTVTDHLFCGPTPAKRVPKMGERRFRGTVDSEFRSDGMFRVCPSGGLFFQRENSCVWISCVVQFSAELVKKRKLIEIDPEYDDAPAPTGVPRVQGDDFGGSHG